MGKELFELQRALDCLVAQPAVDGTRLGAIGHSAGGLLAALLMYVDQRVKAGCVSCGTWLVGNAYRDDYLRPMQGFGGLVAIPAYAGGVTWMTCWPGLPPDHSWRRPGTTRRMKCRRS